MNMDKFVLELSLLPVLIAETEWDELHCTTTLT